MGILNHLKSLPTSITSTYLVAPPGLLAFAHQPPRASQPGPLGPHQLGGFAPRRRVKLGRRGKAQGCSLPRSNKTRKIDNENVFKTEEEKGKIYHSIEKLKMKKRARAVRRERAKVPVHAAFLSKVECSLLLWLR